MTTPKWVAKRWTITKLKPHFELNYSSFDFKLGHFVCLFILNFFLVGNIDAQLAKERVYTQVDQSPYFPGCQQYPIQSVERKKCSDQQLINYIFKNIQYPQAAKDEGIEGAVYLRFVLDEEGRVTAPQILKGIGGGCDEAAITVLENMPKWEPAYYQGKKVKMALEIPIHFYLKENSDEIVQDYKLTWGQIQDYELSRKTIRKNLDEAIKVYNAEGEIVITSGLRLIYKKNKKIISKTSSGNLTVEMEQMLKKLRKGGLLSIVATIQHEGQLLEIDREFEITR